MKRLLSFLLCIAIVLACVSGASAQGTETETGTLKVMNYNIDGLPIPAFMTSENRDPLACALKLPDTINAYDADLIAMQEDFNFHFIYK